MVKYKFNDKSFYQLIGGIINSKFDKRVITIN